MNDVRLEINEKSIANELLGYKNEPYNALLEYIWNSFDAGATEVNLSYSIPETGLGYIDYLEILDNGAGWDFETIDTKTFLSSKKSDEKKSNKTLPHGRWGRGRYVFYWFAEKLISFSKNKQLVLDKNLNVERKESSRMNGNGTLVQLYNLSELFSDSLKNITALESALALEFCWFLKEHPTYIIKVNGKKLDYSGLVKKELTLSVNDFSEELRKNLNVDIKINIVLWNQRPKEFAKFYFVNPETNREIFTAYTSLNKKKDDYWHSVYIYSTLFTSEDAFNLQDENQQKLFNDNTKLKKKLLEEIRKYLIILRKPILLERSDMIVSGLHSEEVIPKLDNFGILDTESFDDLLKQVFIIAPFLFIGKSKEDKMFLCSVLAGLLSSNDSTLISTILQQVQTLSNDEQSDLLDILQRTTLSNMVKTIKEIDYRLQVIDDLNNLVFDLEKYTLEVANLQKVLNQNPWVFGEQFRLFRDTEGSLRKTLIDYAKTILEIEDPNIETHSRKELDLFLVKSLEERETIHRNIIVEIKRPSIILGKKEFDQIENYALTITKEPSCNGSTMWWEFYLIGDSYNDYIESKIDSSKNYGEMERGLATSIKDGKAKIYVRKWSDILHSELGYKMKFLKEKLQIETNRIKTKNPTEISDKYN